MSGIKEVCDTFIDALEKVPEEFAKEFKTRVEDRTPVRTGTLKRGWNIEPTSTGVSIVNDVEYSSFVEYGTYKMEGRFMMTSTMLEADQILEIAVQRAGLTK